MERTPKTLPKSQPNIKANNGKAETKKESIEKTENNDNAENAIGEIK